MTDPTPRSPSPIDDTLSFTGSRITFLSLTGQGDVVQARNIPDPFSAEEFGVLVMGGHVSSISGRTVGAMVRHVARTGEVARARCDLSKGRFSGSCDLEFWRQDDGCVGLLVIDATGKDGDSGSVRSLSLELAHRTKNVMAVVLSLANQTAGRMPDYERFKVHFFGQIQALSNAHDIVAATGWQGAAVGTIIGACVDAGSADTTVTVAPTVTRLLLKPSAVQNIVIVLRELQAACRTSERIVFDVGKAGDGGLEFVWSCEGGFDRDGLWTDMLCSHAPVSFDGHGEIEFAEKGFRYRLIMGDSQIVDGG